MLIKHHFQVTKAIHVPGGDKIVGGMVLQLDVLHCLQ